MRRRRGRARRSREDEEERSGLQCGWRGTASSRSTSSWPHQALGRPGRRAHPRRLGRGALLVAVVGDRPVVDRADRGCAAPRRASWVDWRLRKIRRDFAEQLPDTLDVVASALRAGHSLVGALGVAVDGAPEPSTQRARPRARRRAVSASRSTRRSSVVAHRMDEPRPDPGRARRAMLQREAGTNSAEVLDRVATNVRHQMELRRLIRTLTAQGRMSRWIVSLLPVGLFLAMFLAQPQLPGAALGDDRRHRSR